MPARGSLSARVAEHRHLIDVIVDQLKAVQTVPLQLPNLTDQEHSGLRNY